jgi:transposase
LMGLMVAQERLEERVRVLEVKGAASSRNSSVAPSADKSLSRQERRALARTKAKEALSRDGERREAGGQPGHRGSGRGLLGEDQMKEIIDHYPSECSGCGHEFAEVEKVPRWGAGRHQVAELPPITVEYVEHRTQALRCPGCHTRTRGTLGVVGESAFGPLLQAALVTLTARNRISRRDLSELAGELFQVGISVGAIDEICQRASALLAGPHERLLAGVLASGAINVDETGWFLEGENRSMWTAAHRGGSDLRDRGRSPSRPFDRASGPRVRGDRDLRSLVGLRPPGSRAQAGMLVASTERLQGPQRRAGPAERVRAHRPCPNRPAIHHLARVR